MQEHHQRALDATIPRVSALGDVQLILLGGSIAKGTERKDSDVDLIVVVHDEGYEERIKSDRVAFLYRDVADYPGGYAEGRFVSRSFVFAAAERGSEPTRHSFVGVRPVWGTDEALLRAIAKIPVYPEAEREHRIAAFYAQLVLQRSYFWREAVRREDLYLQLRAAADIVLFGGRMVLAHHRALFQNQKRLMESVERLCPELGELGRALLAELSEDSLERFCEAVFAMTGKPQVDVNSAFLRDTEMSWFTGSHAIAEW